MHFATRMTSGNVTLSLEKKTRMGYKLLYIYLSHSWGTKGDNTLQMDLGIALKANTTEKGVEAVEVEFADEQGLVDRYYEDALHSLTQKQDVIQQVIVTANY